MQPGVKIFYSKYFKRKVFEQLLQCIGKDNGLLHLKAQLKFQQVKGYRLLAFHSLNGIGKIGHGKLELIHIDGICKTLLKKLCGFVKCFPEIGKVFIEYLQILRQCRVQVIGFGNRTFDLHLRSLINLP